MREAHIRDLIAVVETGSVRAAARRLGLTQAAVSKNLSALERSFGEQLLIRSAHGVEPTEYGRVVLRRARVIEAELRKLDEELAGLSGKRRGAVSIGVSSTAAATLLAPAIERFRKQWPDTPVNICSSTPAIAVKGIREGAIDFAVCPAPSSLSGDDIHTEHLFSADITVIGRARHPLAEHATVESLVPYQWIIGARNSVMERSLTDAFREHGLPAPSILIQRDSFNALIHLLMQSDLLAIVSYPSVQEFCERGILKLIPVPLKLPPMVQCLITSISRPLTSSADALASEFRRVSRHFRR